MIRPHLITNRVRRAALRPIVRKVNDLEAQTARLSDAELRRSAPRLRECLSRGAELDGLMPEAFALVREAAKRQIGERPFDVQVMGGVAMHHGWIAEMQTGEGKTLAATLPAFLNALPGRGVHVVTVNDYLASRDAEWMGSIYRALGLSVGCLVHDVGPRERAATYRADITYGTNKEFAFDYLRDQLRAHAARNAPAVGVFERHAMRTNAGGGKVQRGHHFAIVDEVDSILIDEARVPLIISEREGEVSPWASAYTEARELALRLREGQDYILHEEERGVQMTVRGIERVRQAAAGGRPGRPFEHLVEQALRAEHLFQRDREYLVVDDHICIVDEFTGRQMPDRSWSLGQHQAIEAKEGVPVTDENRTLASVTFQRYFKLYEKLAGMTGTARESSAEFSKVFGLPVAAVPTNRPMRRRRMPCQVFATWADKYQAVVERVRELHRQGRPVLVGTRSVRRSEELSRRLSECGIEHNVLNARNHAAEARVIAEAGQPGRVTIATNLAGRGVDVLLGQGVAQVGGLHVLGTELHEASRIDRQLGGRAGRQGEPGSYEFFLSLEDDILGRWSKTLGSWLRCRAQRAKGGRVSRLHLPFFRLAQRGIERRHLRIRVDLLEYDERLEEMKGSLGAPAWG